MSTAFVSVLATHNPGGAPSAHMGRLRTASFPVDPEALLRALVTDPIPIVGRLVGDAEGWPAEHAAIVEALARATTKAEKNEIKLRIPALVPARFKGDARTKDDCIERQIVGHDFDAIPGGSWDEVVTRVREMLPDRWLAMHTTATARNPDGTWRVRVYEVLDRAATPTEWDAHVKTHMRALGEHDANALDVARLLYMPVRTADYQSAVVDGPRTSLADILELPPDSPPAPAERPAAAVAIGDTTRHAAVLLASAWPATGSRNNAVMTLAGALSHSGWSEPEARAFVGEVYEHVDRNVDRDELDTTVRNTFRRAAEGKSIAGWPSLGQFISPAIVSAVRGLLDPMAEARARFEEEHAPKPDAVVESISEATEKNSRTPEPLAKVPITSDMSVLERLRALKANAPRAAEPEQKPSLPVVVEVLPSFPVDALPPALRDFVVAEAEYTQTPVDLAAMLALGCCSAAIAGKADIDVGWIEPLNLFVVVALPPGERKSSVFEATFAPLLDVEWEKSTAAAPLIAAARTQRDLLVEQIKRTKTELAKLKPELMDQEWAANQTGNTPRGGLALKRQIGEMETRLRLMDVPSDPRLLADDVTMERLAGLLAEQGGRMCIASAEGTIFAIAAGRYSKGQASFDVLLKGHAGESLRVDRQSKDRPPVNIARAFLTLALAVQPSVVAGLSSDSAMRGQGLLARFLYSTPASRIGHRDIDAPRVPEQLRARYAELVKRLARIQTPQEAAVLGKELPPDGALNVDALLRQRETAIPTFGLSVEAARLFREFRLETENRLRPKGDLADLADWAGKWPGAVARIAGILHCAEHGPTGDVSEATIKAAIEIGRYLLAHARAAFGSMSTPAEASDAEALLEWLRRNDVRQFSVRDITRRMSPRSIARDKKRREAAVEALFDQGVIERDGPGFRLA